MFFFFFGIVGFTIAPEPRPDVADPSDFGTRGRGSTSITLFFSFLFSMLLFDSNLLRFSTQHDPILDPKLAPISLSFALLFQITFPIRFPTSFWNEFGTQIDVKIDQKSIKKFFQNQPTNKSYFSFIFNQISKTISCSSKMVEFRKSYQNLMFLFVFRHPIMPTKANTRYATH